MDALISVADGDVVGHNYEVKNHLRFKFLHKTIGKKS